MLEPALKEQLKGIFAGLEADFTFDISVSASHESRAELLELLYIKNKTRIHQFVSISQ